MNPTQSPTVTHVEIFRFNIPFTTPVATSLGTFTHAASLLVRVHSSDGLYGTGESSPIGAITGESQDTSLAASQVLADGLIGKDPYEIEARLAEMSGSFHHASATRAAYDLALYDLLGKKANLPLYALLGGQKRTILTDITLPMVAPEAMAALAVEYVSQGYQALKLKLGTSKQEDVARVRAIRLAVGPGVALRLDANQAWDYPTAAGILRALETFDIQYCEQPVPHWDIDSLRRLRQSCAIPIMADESLFDHRDAFRLAETQAVDYFNIKLAKSGGIHNALKINAIGEAAGIRCMVGCMFETRLGLGAAAHLASARPNIIFADLDASLYHSEDPIIGGIHLSAGKIELPDAPGLGADVKAEALAAMDRVVVGDNLKY